MRKVDNGEKKKENIMLFIEATNVVASPPLECRLTGKPTAHAKSKSFVTREESNMKDDKTKTFKGHLYQQQTAPLKVKPKKAQTGWMYPT